ncbi:hypothetical protein XA22_12265 [Staphylococcus cohnii subsp. cohnii]|nr:hypothetical protein XA21_12750 [Staphylococcus cohnii subsp. cohnii]KKD21934.1 hypothetical protein XA22_12265 [Staphylococcus cohnii subsp. cohnii]
MLRDTWVFIKFIHLNKINLDNVFLIHYLKYCSVEKASSTFVPIFAVTHAVTLERTKMRTSIYKTI